MVHLSYEGIYMTKREEELELDELFEIMERHGVKDSSEQTRLLLKLIVSTPDLMDKLKKQNPELAQEVVRAARAEGLLQEA